MKIGELAILNVGAGDTTLSFDPKKPAEVERAKRIVTDMLKRGFAILVEVGKRKGEPLYQRAKGFDPKTCEYLIVGVPDEPEEASEEEPAEAAPPPRGKARRKTVQRVPAAGRRAVAVARSAGG